MIKDNRIVRTEKKKEIDRLINRSSLPVSNSLNSFQSFQTGVKVSKEVKTLRYNRRLINSINLN